MVSIYFLHLMYKLHVNIMVKYFSKVSVDFRCDELQIRQRQLYRMYIVWRQIAKNTLKVEVEYVRSFLANY